MIYPKPYFDDDASEMIIESLQSSICDQGAWRVTRGSSYDTSTAF